MTSAVSSSPAAESPMPDLAAISAEKRRVAWLSMTAAAVMTLLKLAAGLLSGSLGVLSDSAHSGLDLAGSALTFFSVNVSDKPADEDHTYGHGKIENFSAFGETCLMAVSCVWIVVEAIQRIFTTPSICTTPCGRCWCCSPPSPWISGGRGNCAPWPGAPDRRRWPLTPSTSPLTFGPHRQCWPVSGVTWLGARFGIAALHYADPCAAVVVSLLILRMAIRLGHEAVGALMDEIPAETRRRLVREVERVEGVLAVERVRVRRAGAGYFADLTLALPRRFTFEHTGKLVQAATEAVHRALPRTDVVIHTVPRETRAESIFDRVRAVAARNNVSVHELSVQTHDGRLRVEQHLELDENLPLSEAHVFVTAMEAEILRNVPEIDSVLTHIESEPATIEQPGERVETDRRIEQAMQAAARRSPRLWMCMRFW